MNKVQQKTKPTLQSITRPPNEVLVTMIKAVESEVGSIDSIEELAQIINKRFNIQVSTNDLYNNYYNRTIFGNSQCWRLCWDNYRN